MIELLKEYSFLAPYATTIGVGVAMAQLWRSASQGKTTFEDSIAKEYREIVQRIPYKALVGFELCQQEKDNAFNEIYNYMDLCNEQIFLRMNRRIRKSTWKNWQEGMKVNFSLPFFAEASNEILQRLPSTFTELRRVMDSDYRTDPRSW